MLNNNIISIEDLKMFGRPMSNLGSDQKYYAFITEVEMLYIKPTFGDDLYLTLVENANNVNPSDERIKILLEGGVYKPADYGKNDGNRFYLEGLKKCIAYYVFSQHIMSGDYESSRYGFVVKNNDYSDKISDKQRSNYYNNIIEIAKGYLNDCIKFCKISGLIRSKGKSLSKMGGITITKIG